jgi:5'-3' exonuclease
MGIPSFYRHLCKKYPAIIAKGASPVVGSEWLCLDFNCAMYWVLRKMRPLSDNQYVWEGELCDAIADYMAEIIQEVQPTKGVFVSCDGVVCAAKRRQQRLRRFKGPWIAAAEGTLLGKAVNSGWDQNALTPGSAFMKRLGDVLTAAGAVIAKEKGITVTVSTTSEPGEGEHKLLAAMRRERPGSCVIYGLDADLILLSLLLLAETGATVSLLRETQEFERGGGREGGWRILSVNKLKDAMFPSAYAGTENVQDFVAGMSLLGNDFLPHSLTRTVRDDGIPQLLRVLQQDLWARGQSLVSVANGKIRREGLLTLVRSWAAAESGDMFMAVLDAYKASRYSVGEGETPQETALREWNALPARWASVTRILAPSRKDLVGEWKEIYRGVWGGGEERYESEYLQGVAWVWDYYSGRVVDQGWAFDHPLPPLWCDLVTFLEKQTPDSVIAPPVKYPTALPEWLHLLSVLPVDSVRRLLPQDKHRLMLEHPWFWPSSWKLFDVGRSQMWECEPMIPLLPEALLRANA